MTECSQAQEELLAGTGLIHELSESIQEHVRACEECTEFALKRRRLRRLAKSTQEIVRNELDLPPAAWARIRSSVEEEIQPEPILSVFLRWFPVAAIPVLVIGFGWFLLNQQQGTGAGGQQTVSVAADSVQGSKVRAVTARKGDFKALGQTKGGVIEAGRGLAVASLQTGHSLELKAHSKVKIKELTKDRVALNLEAGSVTCEVRKLRPNESFEVYAKGLRVAVVGTRFTVAISSDGVPSVSVAEGRVAVTQQDGRKALLGAGETLDGSEEVASDSLAKAEAADVSAGTDVSGVPVMRETSEREAPQKVRKKAVSSKSRVSKSPEVSDAPGAEAPRKDAGHVIEVTVNETMEAARGADSTEVRSRLVGVIGMIRSGNCSAAQSALSAINLMNGASRYRADITYLSGYCHRKKGDVGRSERLFTLYRKLSKSRRWKIPTAHDEVLPIPSASHLAK